MEKKYIYNQQQGNFFISQGCIPVEWGYSKIKNKMYLAFKTEDVQDAFEKWIQKCREHANIANH